MSPEVGATVSGVIDPGTAIAALGPSAVVKILGPTADYIGAA
jgi:hypothetical protein